MTNKSYAHLELLIDESGSMHHLQKTVLEAVNGLIQEQANVGGHATITVSTFDSAGVRTSLNFAPLTQDTKFSEYHPNAATPLYDAIGQRVVTLGNRLEAMPESERPGVVMFAIMTDGYENDSTEYTHESVKKMVEHQERVYGWKFVFLGANIDTNAVGQSIGVSATVSYLATVQGTSRAINDISGSFTSYRTA